MNSAAARSLRYWLAKLSGCLKLQHPQHSHLPFHQGAEVLWRYARSCLHQEKVLHRKRAISLGGIIIPIENCSSSTAKACLGKLMLISLANSWLHWWNKDHGQVLSSICAPTMRRKPPDHCCSASQPKCFAVLLGELHLVDSSKITNEWNWDRDRLLGISILYSQLVNSHHICTWLFHTISSFPIRTHLLLQSCFCNSLALPLSHPVQPAFPLFLHLTLSPSRSTRATFETMLFWQCSDGNQALWLPSKGKSCPSSKHLALPGTAFISSCAALAVWPFRRSNRKHSSTLNWDCGPSAMKTRAEESCKIGQTTAKSKGVNKFNRHFCEYSRNAVTLHASPYPLFVGQFHQWFQTR